MKSKEKVKWWDLADEEILQMRIRDFNLSIQDSPIESFIDNLHKELEAKGIVFHPPCYLADEWLCPDKEPIIGIPFCLAHPRLKNIELKMMLEVEGGTEKSFMKLLRHETGHALNYAYKLYNKTRWRQLFGPFSRKYSNSYYFQPYSRRFVIHLEDNYAQSHPDEDFAETFAVWLAPNSCWEEKYKGWPVIKKLLYIDGLITKVCSKPPTNTSQGRPPWAASRMTSTLGSYYERKHKMLGEEFKGFYDDALKRLFSEKCDRFTDRKASKLLRQHRKALVNYISTWTGHRKYDIHQLINKLANRCENLKLYGKDEDIIGTASLICAIACNTLRIPERNKR
jgi:hypothetical protein